MAIKESRESRECGVQRVRKSSDSIDSLDSQDSLDLYEQATGAHILARSWSVESAYRYAEKIARSHYENFPVGSVLVPGKLRKHFCAIYAFARTADDFADEGSMTRERRLEALEKWREMLRQSLTDRTDHPIFVALSSTCRELDLPLSLFEDLISAFEQDLTTTRYHSFDQLLDYCSRSANPIGRLILLVFGHRNEQFFSWSDSICTALQLANHWQDVAVDLDKDRIYLPEEDLSRFHLSEDDLKRREVTAQFRDLMRMETGRARKLFLEGKPLCTSVGGRLGVELRAVWLGGWRILERIEHNGFDLFTKRPVITSADKLRILFSALIKSRFALR